MISIITTGGTIDKIYFDAKNDYQVGESPVKDLLNEARVGFDFNIESVTQKDSMDLTDQDRESILSAVKNAPTDKVVITHGTDTMVETARLLKQVPEKTIVLTGALSPARFRSSDAEFNIGAAMIAAQTLPYGVYITMNGLIFDPDKVRKNVEKELFEEIE